MDILKRHLLSKSGGEMPVSEVKVVEKYMQDRGYGGAGWRESEGGMGGFLKVYRYLYESIRYRDDIEEGLKKLIQNEEVYDLADNLWSVYLPLAVHLRSDKAINRIERCKVLGVLGSQGTGKTLMSKMMKLTLETLGSKVLYFSSDDFYLMHSERLKLKEAYPFLEFRGPPGTHDIDLMNDVLDRIKNGEEVRIPVFDKSLNGGMGDRTGFIEVPESRSYDYCIFEGWFNGLRSLPKSQLEGKSELSHFSNESLSLYGDWSVLDRLFIIRPEDFGYSYTWRLEAEKRMGKGMSEVEVSRFVSYFMEALDPQTYYTHLYKEPTNNIGMEFVIDLNHKVTHVNQYK